MRRARLWLAVPLLVVALAGCFGPKPYARFVEFSAAELRVAAGGSGSIDVTYELVCRKGAGTTEDGCAYERADGSVDPVTHHLTLGTMLLGPYTDPWDDSVVEAVSWYYLGHPHDALPDGIQASASPKSLSFDAVDGARATSRLVVEVDAATPPGSYDLWVKGVTSADSAAEKFTVIVSAPAPANRVTGVIDDWNDAWTDGEVQAVGVTTYGTGAIAADGGFAFDLATPTDLVAFDFTGCSVTGHLEGVNHTGAGLLAVHGETMLALNSVGSPVVTGLLYVDAAASGEAVCDFGGAGHAYVYDYDFDAPGWYAQYEAVDAGSGTYTFTNGPLNAMPQHYTAD